MENPIRDVDSDEIPDEFERGQVFDGDGFREIVYAVEETHVLAVVEYDDAERLRETMEETDATFVGIHEVIEGLDIDEVDAELPDSMFEA